MAERASIRDVLSVAGQEALHAPWYRKATLGGSVIGFAYEWGPTNESVLGATSFAVIHETHNTLATVAATAAVSLASQTALGVLAAVNMRTFPETMRTIRNTWARHRHMEELVEDTEVHAGPEESNAREMLFGPTQDCEEGPADARELLQEQTGSVERTEHDNGEPERLAALIRTAKSVGSLVMRAIRAIPKAVSQVGARFGNAFAMGTTINCVLNNSREERVLRQDIKTALEDAGLIALGVAGLSAAIAGANAWGRATGHEEIADWSVGALLLTPSAILAFILARGAYRYYANRDAGV